MFVYIPTLELASLLCERKGKMTEDQRIMYDNVGEVRNTDVTVRWSIASIFLTLNTVGFTFVMNQWVAEKPIFIGLYLTGLFLGSTWLYLNLRMQRWIGYWNSRLEAIEAEVELQAIRVFGGDEYRQILTHEASTYNILLTLNVVVMLAWLGLFEYSLFFK